MENKNRLAAHQKNQKTEDLLRHLEELLFPSQKAILNLNIETDHAPVFIMGCARSGTTALLQYLAQSGAFCYPSNLMSRFYFAPYLGARIHQLLIDHDVKGELAFEQEFDKFSSQLGKTKGADAPHEYWYFWRRYFSFKRLQTLSKSDLDLVDAKSLRHDILSIMYAFDKPVVMKAMNLNWHIPFLNKIFPNALFIHIKRKIEYNAQSLLNARVQFFGDISQWYSFKPPEYDEITIHIPEEQVVQQVHFTNKAISDGLVKVDDANKVVIEYESLCRDPKAIIDQILASVGKSAPHPIVAAPVRGNKINVSREQWYLIQNACQKLI